MTVSVSDSTKTSRLTFKTAYCTNALSAMKAAGIEGVIRIERTTRYQLSTDVENELFLELAGDRMTGKTMSV